MHTHPLIGALVEDLPSSPRRMSEQIRFRVGISTVLVGSVFYGLYGLRDDGIAALGDVRFLFKLSLLLALILALWPVLHRAAGPIAVKPRDLRLLGWAALYWLAMIGGEAMLLPRGEWNRALMGENGIFCLTVMPLIGLPLLAAMLVTLRGGAPEGAVASGAVAGFFCASVAGLIYAVHCPDESPFFVVFWYGAVAIALTVMGALSGRLLLRW